MYPARRKQGLSKERPTRSPKGQLVQSEVNGGVSTYCLRGETCSQVCASACAQKFLLQLFREKSLSMFGGNSNAGGVEVYRRRLSHVLDCSATSLSMLPNISNAGGVKEAVRLNTASVQLSLSMFANISNVGGVEEMCYISAVSGTAAIGSCQCP
jgi:hypothetical protein